MDDQFEEPLIYSSDSDDCELEQHENNQETNDAIQDKGDVIEAAPPSSQSLDKRIDDILEEAEQRSSPIEDDEPIFSGKGKKSKKIISSDDDESDAATVQSDANEETKALGNDDTDEDKAPTPSPTETVEKVPVPVRSTLWDSDTSSGNERATEEPAKPAKKKVLKKKKKKKEKDSKKDPKKDKKKRIVEREGSGSESSDASGSEKREKNSESDGESSQSSSDTDEETTADDNVPVRPREKPKPRMSAKAAAEQIREIQSESQRLARQIYIEVPYHKPKQHSLKEFLNRRSLTKQQELLSQMPMKKAAAAIKMSAEELQKYAELMEQRAQEAIEFFKNEDDEPTNKEASEESDDEEAKNESKLPEKPDEAIVDATQSHDAVENLEINSPSSAEPEEVATMDIEIPEIESTTTAQPVETVEPVADIEPFIKEQTTTPPDKIEKERSSGPTSSNIALHTEASSNIALHTEKSELDSELDKMIHEENRRKKLQALSLALDVHAAPKLSGNRNMIIDFESNEVKPRVKSGIEELQERFLQNAMKKPKVENQSSKLSVFNTEIGDLETISHFNQSVMAIDPKPGQAFYKLKYEIGKKLGDKRREILLKRLEDEKQKRLEMESDDEEEIMEEYSDCEGEDDGEGEEKEQEADDGTEIENELTKTAEGNETGAEDEEELPGNEFFDDEAEDSENEDESSSESDEEDNEELTATVNKIKRSRIIAAFEDDSGDEMPPPNGQTSMAIMDTSVRSLDDSAATDQSFGELPQTASTQMDDAKRQAIMDDMNEFESRMLDTTTQIEVTRPETTTSVLFPDSVDDGEIGESQLMALCSGAFVTQKLPSEGVANDETSNSTIPESAAKATTEATEDKAAPIVSETVPKVDLKAALLSSDEENPAEGDGESKKKKRKTKKNKKKKLDYSDDEEDDEKLGAEAESSDADGEDEGEEEEEAVIEDEEEDLGERYVEYDSDENEIEVKVAKKELRKKASEFVEQEAELSESEWGSADEDEKGLDEYDGDLVNDEEFDQTKLQSELERIRMREQIDQDAREVRILKEMYIEDEEDIGQRERKFRWKNVDNTDMSILQASTDTDLPADNEEDENEEEWRRLRYEREQLLLKQMSPDGNADHVNAIPSGECNQTGDSTMPSTTVMASIFRRTSVVKTATNSPRISSPFLINSSALMTTNVGRKSFLNRDEKTLEKLVHLTKASGDGETIKSTATGKGNYLFVATEKKFAEKRKSTTEPTAENDNPSKKIKVNEAKKKEKSKPSLGFFELLGK